MLAELRIRNVAVIEDLALAFEPGLNVVTGETGAGKTILMRAIGLVLGDRGGADLVRSGAAQAEIEALFTGDAVRSALQTSAAEDDGPAEDEVVVRRVIAAGGRQRAFLNDRLVTAGRLAALGERLAHVYGQHEHHTLVRPEVQRAILDAAGGLDAETRLMDERFRALAAAEERLATVRAGTAGVAARRELLAFQLRELDGVCAADELAELERERGILRHAERLRETAAEAEHDLSGADGAVVETLARLATRLGAVGPIDPVLGEAARLLEEARPLLEEAALMAAGRARAIAADPERLERIEERLAHAGRLARKHGCPAAELAERRAALGAELAGLDSAEADPGTLEREVGAAATAAWAAADALSAARVNAAERLRMRVASGLAELSLPTACLSVAFEPLAPDAGTPASRIRDGRALGAHGAERVSFLFAPNRGEAPRPLARIVSGGELSRVMLAFKAATASATEVPTLLFDEVDAGIGGAVAEAVGRRLAGLARGRQILCITHLPQIAACADHHFAIRKRPARGRTRTWAARLSNAERVEELARMLAGIEITEEARRHAAELSRLGRRSR